MAEISIASTTQVKYFTTDFLKIARIIMTKNAITEINKITRDNVSNIIIKVLRHL